MALRRSPSDALATMIVDPDAAASRRLRDALASLSGVSVTCAAKSLPGAIEKATACRPDVVFLDAAMADGRGLDIVQHLDRDQAVVVVTDRPDYAVRAFQIGAVDYLLKPVETTRLEETLRRLDRLFGRSRNPEDGTASTSDRLAITDRLPIPGGRGQGNRTTELVPVEQVAWIESMQNYSIVQLSGNARRRLKRTLAEWTALLPEREFVRVGRSHLLHFAKLRATESPSRNELLVHCDGVAEPLRLGRAAGARLKTLLRRRAAAS